MMSLAASLFLFYSLANYFLLSSCCLLASPTGRSLLEIVKSRWSHSEFSVNPNEHTYTPVYIGSQDGLMKADKIDALPGQPPGVNFDQYAGYVTVDPAMGRALFYYFVESPNDASTKPLILWFNGGPGCSSLGGGAMMEFGPLRPNSDAKTLRLNKNSWNNVANILFLESPAGVGFSYSNMSFIDYKLSSDIRTARDAYTFLINWLERFPQYKARDFFIAGESFGGYFVPELATTIVAHNSIKKGAVVNLKGIAIGNPSMKKDQDSKLVFEYYWSHSLISNETYQQILSQCDFVNGTLNRSNNSYECNKTMASMAEEIGPIDHYNIDGPICTNAFEATNLTGSEVDPCAVNHLTSYLNLRDVQNALHANVTMLPYLWSACSVNVGTNWGRKNWDVENMPASTLPMIKELIGSGIRVLVYSGDLDSVIPITSTRNSINMLGLPIEQPWRPWYADGEVGGYTVGYKGLTFTTVRGAGHFVPLSQPKRSLTLIASFLQGKQPPTSFHNG